MLGQDLPLSNQINLLHQILQKNKYLYDVILGIEKFNLSDYYIGAGCIAQTVWNYQNGNPLLFGINDIDFVYFDVDLSDESENNTIKLIESEFYNFPLTFDINNQARVHIWYKDYFGYDIKPYNSIESAINTWPTTATSVGVKIVNKQFQVYAPYGLNDLFSQIIRPNKLQITEETYYKKVHKWKEKWSSLTITPW